MAKRNTPFIGLLYCDLATTSRGVRVVEFNVHLGDPETQVILERPDSPLVELLHAAATGTLDQVPTPRRSTGAATTVVMASGGYSGPSGIGHEITGIDKVEAIPGIHITRADTSWKIVSPEGALIPTGSGPETKEVLVNPGDRILNVMGRAVAVQAARALACESVKQILFAGEHHRSDIATWPAELDLSVGSDLKN